MFCFLFGLACNIILYLNVGRFGHGVLIVSFFIMSPNQGPIFKSEPRPKVGHLTSHSQLLARPSTVGPHTNEPDSLSPFFPCTMGICMACMAFFSRNTSRLGFSCTPPLDFRPDHVPSPAHSYTML